MPPRERLPLKLMLGKMPIILEREVDGEGNVVYLHLWRNGILGAYRESVHQLGQLDIEFVQLEAGTWGVKGNNIGAFRLGRILGLRSGDTVIEVNGLTLDSPGLEQLMAIGKQLEEAKSNRWEVTLLREGKTVNAVVDLSF